MSGAPELTFTLAIAAASADVARRSALAAAGLLPQYWSSTDAYAPVPTVQELQDYDVLTGYRTVAGRQVRTRYDRAAAKWIDSGGIAATLADARATLTPSVTFKTLQDLSAFDRQGIAFAFTDGDRFEWREVSPLPNNVADGGAVIPALGGGFWVRQFTNALRGVWYRVQADGVTDDTAALQLAATAAADLWKLPLDLPIGTLITTAEIITVNTLIANGQYSNVGMFEWSTPLKIARTEIRRITRGGAEQAVLRCRGAANFISFIQFTASQVEAVDGFGPIKYDVCDLTKVDLSQSTDYGLVFEGTAKGSTAYRCEFTQAAKRGFVGGQVYGATASADGRISPRAVATDPGNVMRLQDCMSATNGAGATMNATDSKVVQSYLHHNAGEGLLATGSFAHISGNRAEWNGTNGFIIRAAESDFVNNLADRNGFSGLWLDSKWRCQVVGNSFSRNGAAGDGAVGRWGFSTPGTRSYATTPEEECCHIRLTYMRNVTITGNSYRAGLSDSNDGVLSPACIYYGLNVADCPTIGNSGEFAYVGGSGGYAPTHRLYATGVEKLTNFSVKSVHMIEHLNDSMPTCYGTDTGQVDSVDVPLPPDFFGTVEVYGGRAATDTVPAGTVFAVVEVLRRADKAFGLVNLRSSSGSIAVTATAVDAGVHLSTPAGSQVYMRYICRRVL